MGTAPATRVRRRSGSAPGLRDDRLRGTGGGRREWPAVGLGCTLAVLCDIVLIADDAYMADTHVNVGLVAGDGGAVTWPLLMSILRAKEFILLGERIPEDAAIQYGLANRTVPGDRLLEEARTLAHRLADQPQQALRDTKRAPNLHMQNAANMVLPFALSAETESFASEEVRRLADDLILRRKDK